MGSKEGGKIHQVKSSFTGEKFRNTDYYCGKRDVVPIEEVFKAEIIAGEREYCRRCLRALQLRKGHEFMLENKLPLQNIRKY